MSVNFEDLSDINPDILNSLWEDPHRRKYIRRVSLNRTGMYGPSFDRIISSTRRLFESYTM